MIWYFLVFFLGFSIGVVLTALVSVERGNEAYQAGVKFGKKYAEEMARIDRMADEDGTDDFESGKKVIEYLEHMPPAQQWILCSERLPEADERCLCTYEFDEGICVDFGVYTKRGWFVSGVTAWMPLPKPYKEKRSEE